MAHLRNASERDPLLVQLNEKRKAFEQQLHENKKFDDVKSLFYEIRNLEKTLKQEHKPFQIRLR